MSLTMYKDLSALKDFDQLGDVFKKNYSNFMGKKLVDLGELPFIQKVVKDVVTNVKHMTGIDFVFRYSTYMDEDKFSHFKIMLANSRKDSTKFKKDLILSNQDCLEDLFFNLKDFITEYKKLQILNENLFILNKEFISLCKENNIGYIVQFGVGEGILDVSDKHIVFGIDADKILSLHKLNLFHDNDILRDGYKNAIVDTLNMVDFPYELAKLKNFVTKDFGMYSKKKLTSLIKEVYNRNAEKIRIGVGYLEDEKTFAVVKKESIREDDSLDYVSVHENTSMTKEEQKQGKTKIGVKYIITPFDKKTFIKI